MAIVLVEKVNLFQKGFTELSPSFSPSRAGIAARSFSGMAWDNYNRKLINFGGAHGSYLGNDVDVYDPVTNTFTQAYSPEFPANPSDEYTHVSNNGTLPEIAGANRDTPTGKPWSAHSYQAMAFNNAGVMVYLDMRLTTWAWSATGGWIRMNPSATPGQDSSSDEMGISIAHCSTSDRFLAVLTDGTSWIYQYTGIVTAPWTQVTGTQPPQRNCHAMAYDSANDVVVLFGGQDYGDKTDYGDTWIYDCVAGSWAQAEPTGDVPSPREAHGMAFCTLNNLTYLFRGRYSEDFNSWDYYNDLYRYDADSDEWESVNASGVPDLDQDGNAAMIFGEFIYMPRYKAFLFLHNVNGYNRPSGDESYSLSELWSYRVE